MSGPIRDGFSEVFGERRGAPTALGTQRLSVEAQRGLQAAASARDYATLLGTVRSQYSHLDAEDQRFCEELLSSYVEHVLAAHHRRWDRRVGALACDLGFSGRARLLASLGGTYSTATPSFDDALSEWQFETSAYDLALENARVNLRTALVKGSSLTVAYAAHLAGMGWREAYTEYLAGAAGGEPEFFFAQLVKAPPRSRSAREGRDRQERIRELSENAGGVHALADALKSRSGSGPNIVQRLYTVYARASGGEPGSARAHRVDAVELLLDLLSANAPGVTP